MDHTILQDRYRIDSELGRGGMGVVYQGHDTLLGRDVAIKVLANTGLGTEGRARLLHEARTAARLSHPNIVTVYDAGQAEDTPFIVMELLPGLSLHEQRPQSMNEIVDIAQQICAALEHAHGQEIIHRDLKPENVMLLPFPSKGEGSREGVTVKLMDFGLARSVTTRLTAEGTIMGTFSYLAPEIALARNIDARADLYSLGVMLYELTTGALPFSDPDPVAVISQHLHAPVVSPRAKNPDIPGPLNDLVVRLLAKEPDSRPDSAAEVRQALERVASPEVPTKPEPGLAELDRIVRGRFVGREAELAEARAVWHQALAGQGQVLLISGEPGIGKTRLVEELVTQATVTGGLAFIGASYAEGGSPYTPFRQILREALGGNSDNGFTLPDTVMADLLALAPELRPADTHLASDYQIEGQQLLDSMVVLFTHMSNKAPLLLVLEDAHWADSGSLALIRHLARNMRQQPLLLVATYREVEVEEARFFHELLVDFGRERIGKWIKLARLDPGGTHDLLATLLAEEITPDFLEGIYRETEGNPFFVEEVCKALIASGQLTYHQGRWRRPSMAELGVPQSIQVTIQSRVRALPEATQKVLEQAAILGREFDFDTLLRAAGSGEDDLIDALELAERAQLIEETGMERGGTFAFVHALIPTTLVTSMRTLCRRRLHKRAARALEAEKPEAYEALAYQFIEAGETEKGIAYLLKAGDRARTLYAHQEAIEDYQQALDYLRDQEDLEQAARVQMKLALVYHNALDFTQSQQAYEEGFELWQRIGLAESDEPLPPAPHPLRIVLLEPATLDPGLDTGLAAPIISHLFSGLTRLSPEMDVLPDVAQSWEMTDGGSKYIFFLRKDVTWSDGARVTAGDFEFAWKRVLDPATGSWQANLLYDIKYAEPYHQGRGIDSSLVGVRVLDDFTLEVVLEGPSSYFLSLLAMMAYPIPSHVVRGSGSDWARPDRIVTNGPFRLASWLLDQAAIQPKLVFERNPTYHGPFSGNLEQVESPLAGKENMSDLWQLYKQDRLDYYHLEGLSQQEAFNARYQHAGEYLSIPRLATEFLVFNTQRQPFDDPRVRQALAMATDRERLANSFQGGYQNPANGGLVPPGMPGHVAGIATPYDPNQARRLLAEAGYPGGRGLPRLEYLAQFWLGRGQDDFLPKQWKENLNLELDVELVSTTLFHEKLSNKSPHFWNGIWVADYPDPDNYLRVGLGRYQKGWRNEQYEQLVERARRTMDQEERLQLYWQAEEFLIEEVPILPLIYGRTHGLLKPWVKSFPISPLQSWMIGSFFWQDVIIEPH